MRSVVEIGRSKFLSRSCWVESTRETRGFIYLIPELFNNNFKKIFGLYFVILLEMFKISEDEFTPG
jgi:hypothetical protein